jgi:hypothetical protein
VRDPLDVRLNTPEPRDTSEPRQRSRRLPTSSARSTIPRGAALFKLLQKKERIDRKNTRFVPAHARFVHARSFASH